MKRLNNIADLTLLKTALLNYKTDLKKLLRIYFRKKEKEDMRVEESQEDRVRGLITSNQISDGETTEWARNPIQRDNGCELFKLHESHKPSQ